MSSIEWKKWFLIAVGVSVFLLLSNPTIYSLKVGVFICLLGFLVRFVDLRDQSLFLKYVRYPVVFSYLTILIGLAIASRSVYVLSLTLLVLMVTAGKWAVVRDEKLLAALGNKYALYMASVPRFFPRVPGVKDPEFLGYLRGKRKVLMPRNSYDFFSFDYPKILPQLGLCAVLFITLYLKLTLVY